MEPKEDAGKNAGKAGDVKHIRMQSHTLNYLFDACFNVFSIDSDTLALVYCPPSVQLQTMLHTLWSRRQLTTKQRLPTAQLRQTTMHSTAIPPEFPRYLVKKVRGVEQIWLLVSMPRKILYTVPFVGLGF